MNEAGGATAAQVEVDITTSIITNIITSIITNIIIDIIIDNSFITITNDLSDYSDGWADRPDVIKGLEEVAVGEQNNFLLVMTVYSWTTK